MNLELSKWRNEFSKAEGVHLPIGLWPFIEWNRLTSNSGVQTKTSSSAILNFEIRMRGQHHPSILRELRVKLDTFVSKRFARLKRIYQNDRKSTFTNYTLCTVIKYCLDAWQEMWNRERIKEKEPTDYLQINTHDIEFPVT